MRKNDSSIKDIVSKTKVSERSVKNILKDVGLTKQSGKTNKIAVINTPNLSSDKIIENSKNLADLFFERAKIKPFNSEKEKVVAHFSNFLSHGYRFISLKAATLKFIFDGYKKLEYLDCEYLLKNAADIDEFEEYLTENKINDSVANLVKIYIECFSADNTPSIHNLPIYMREVRATLNFYSNIDMLKKIIIYLAENDIDLKFIKDRFRELKNSPIFKINKSDKDFISKLIDDYYEITNINASYNQKQSDLTSAIKLYTDRNYTLEHMETIINNMAEDNISINLIVGKASYYEKAFLINRYERKKHARFDYYYQTLFDGELTLKEWNRYNAYQLLKDGDIKISEVKKLYGGDDKTFTSEILEIGVHTSGISIKFGGNYNPYINRYAPLFNAVMTQSDFKYEGVQLKRKEADFYHSSRTPESWVNCDDLQGLSFTAAEWLYKIGFQELYENGIIDSDSWYSISQRSKLDLDGIALEDHVKALLDYGKPVFSEEEATEFIDWVHRNDEVYNQSNENQINTFEPDISRAYTPFTINEFMRNEHDLDKIKNRVQFYLKNSNN